MNRTPAADRNAPHRPRPNGVICWTLAVVMGVMSGCVTDRSEPASRGSSVVVSSAGDLNRALRRVRTVSLHPTARLVGPAPGRSPERLQADTDGAILRELRAHGYTVALTGTGDLMMAYAIGVGGALEDDELLAIFGLAPGIDSQTDLRGGIVLALTNPRSGRVEWRAGVSAPAEPGGYDDAERSRLILDAVHRLLEPLESR